MKTYDWLNPPAGEYRTEDYLDMVNWWRYSMSVDRNELSPPVDPMKLKFFGDKKVTIVSAHTVRLEELYVG